MTGGHGRCVALLGSALLGLGAAPAPDPQAAARAIYEGLGLAAHQGDATDLVVSLPSDAPAPWPAVAQALAELLLARGHRVANLAGEDPELVASGIEWRLSLLPEGAEGGAALWSRIDPGLWGAGPGIGTTRYPLRWPRDDQGPTSVDPPPPIAAAAPLRLGAPSPLGAAPANAWALTACGLEAGPEWLFALEALRLIAYRVDRGRLEPVAELDLSTQEKAARPTRAPLASVVCAGPSEGGLLLGFGHGRLKEGWRVHFDPGSGAKLRWKVAGPLPGIPIANAGARWLVAQPDEGRHRYGSWAWVEADGKAHVVPLPGPLFQASASAPGQDPPGPILGLGPDLKLSIFEGVELTPRATGEPTGLGWCSRRIDGANVWIVSSPLLGEERVGLAGSRDRRALDGPVAAAAVGRFTADGWSAIWAIDRGPRGTAYYWAPVERR